MIRKRQPQKTEAEQKVVVKNKPVRQQQSINSSNNEFRTYREEAIYVLNLLEKQGIDIYDESRYGGMYLNRHSGGKYKHIFSNNENNKNIQSEEIVNNNESNIDFSQLFGSKKK